MSKNSVSLQSEGKPATAYEMIVPKASTERLWKGVKALMVRKRGFLDPDYSAARLAKELDTTTQYISLTLRRHFGANFKHFVNELRVHHAMAVMSKPANDALTMEEVAALSGYIYRQTFHKAFVAITGTTPAKYREQNIKARQNLQKATD